MNRFQIRAFAVGMLGTSLIALAVVLADRIGIAAPSADGAQPVSALLGGEATGLDTAAPATEALAPIPPSWTVHEIERGDTLGKILPRYGAPVQVVLDAAQDHHDLAKIRVGQQLGFLHEAGVAVPTAIRYPLDQDRTLLVERSGDNWTARVDEIVYEHHIGRRALVVNDTLWGAAVEAGLRPADIAAIAGVFQFDIDFNSELQPGARLEVVVDELYLDGEFVRLGIPQAARLENKGKDYVAIRHVHADGSAVYYDEDGVARKRAFLRSPIAFARVTSSFNLKRFHPVLKKKRHHYGVDFGAPTGTPVRAVGDGVITSAGWNGGHGRFVKIDHAGPYDTSYSHLSKINVKRGQRVKQGQVIGKVGSTGMSTGPHLHYQLWYHGKYKNPMTVDLPRNQTLPDSERSAFSGTRDRWMAVLDGKVDPSSLSAPGGEEGPVVADAR